MSQHSWEGAPKGVPRAVSDCVWAMDEVAFISRDRKLLPVLTVGGDPVTQQIDISETGFHLTVCAIVSASGMLLPPFIVFEGKSWPFVK